MTPFWRTVLTFGVVVIAALAVAAVYRVVRVSKAAGQIPVYPGAREAGGKTRYLPRLLSWDDRSSARVQRIFALPAAIPLSTIARDANETLAGQGWYVVSPEDLQIIDPQVVVWQRDPNERLDLMKVWPVPGMTPTQRLYGGIFPAEFLDAPMVIEWSWALGGPRSPRRTVQSFEVRTLSPPLPPAR